MMSANIRYRPHFVSFAGAIVRVNTQKTSVRAVWDEPRLTACADENRNHRNIPVNYRAATKDSGDNEQADLY